MSLVDFTALKRTFVYSKGDFAAMVATIAVTLVAGVEPGLVVGVGLSIFLHLYATSRPHVAVVGQIPGTATFRNVKRHTVVTDPEILSLRVDESLYFPNARFLEDRINEGVAANPELRHVILECPAVNTIDASALESLEAINQRLKDGGITLHLSEVKGPVMDRLKRSHFLEELTGQVHLRQYDAVASIKPELASSTLAAARSPDSAASEEVVPMSFRQVWIVVFALTVFGPDVFAADIIDAKEVAAASQRGAILWDVRSADEYAQGHIPGAVNIGMAAEVLRNRNTEDFVSIERVADLFNGAGIDLSQEVIVYGHTGDPTAYWGLTAVRHFGGKHGRVFHGGLEAWQAAGQPVSTVATRREQVEQELTVDPTIQIYLPEVLSKVGKPGVQFIDTRTPAEFNGDVVHALRGGRIPGAHGIPFEENWVNPKAALELAGGDVKARAGMALKPPAELQALYAGLDPNLETIVYCQSGVRASVTAWILKDLGFDKVRVFEESWLGYGNDLTAPAEAVQFVNVGVLEKRIQTLEATVRKLIEEVEALEAGAAQTR